MFRSSNGLWEILFSSTGERREARLNEFSPEQSHVITPGDDDGDGRIDCAVWRPADGTWLIINSSNGSLTGRKLGVNGDTPVPTDYDGDGKSDIAVWRRSNRVWRIINSSNGVVQIQVLGEVGDVPITMKWIARNTLTRRPFVEGD